MMKRIHRRGTLDSRLLLFDMYAFVDDIDGNIIGCEDYDGSLSKFPEGIYFTDETIDYYDFRGDLFSIEKSIVKFDDSLEFLDNSIQCGISIDDDFVTLLLIAEEYETGFEIYLKGIYQWHFYFHS